MKHHLFSYRILIVLIFGLISCSPDKSGHSEPTEEWSEIPELRIVEVGKNKFTVSKDLQLVRVSDIFTLVFKESGTRRIIAKTVCKSEQLGIPSVQFNGEFTGEQIAVGDLLPIKIYSPVERQIDYVSCDFKLWYLKENNPVQISDLRLKVIGTQSYSNLQLHFLEGNTNNYFFRENINGEIPMTSEEIEAHTLCSHKSKTVMGNTNNLLLSSFFDDELFAQKPTQLCRLVIRDTKTQEVRTSPSFWVQNKAQKLQVHWQSWAQGIPHSIFKDTPLARLTIRNPNPEKVFFKADNLATTLSIVPLYAQVTTDQPTYYEGVVSEVITSWVPHGGRFYNDGSANNTGIYELQPGESMTFDFGQNMHINCHAPPTPKLHGVVTGGCVVGLSMMGVRMGLRIPTLIVNQSSDITRDLWKSLNPSEIPNYPQNFTPGRQAIGMFNMFIHNRLYPVHCGTYQNQPLALIGNSGYRCNLY